MSIACRVLLDGEKSKLVVLMVYCVFRFGLIRVLWRMAITF